MIIQWIKKRLKEPSTYQGLAVLLGSLGVAISPELLTGIGTTVLSVIAVIQIIKKEKEDESV